MERLKTEINQYKNKLEQVVIEFGKHRQQMSNLIGVEERCEILEKDALAWITVRDQMIAQFKASLETERARYEATHILAVETLNK